MSCHYHRAELLVEQNGNYLIVKDLKGHVKLEPKARDAQHVKIFLGERTHVTYLSLVCTPCSLWSLSLFEISVCR